MYSHNILYGYVLPDAAIVRGGLHEHADLGLPLVDHLHLIMTLYMCEGIHVIYEFIHGIMNLI